jgi:nucleoside-diphosphate-sugar epimerase
MAALAASDWATPVAGVRRKVAGEHVILDATSMDDLHNAMKGVQAVVNCMTGDADAIAANAAALFTAADKTGVHVVYLSSMAVYGSATGLIAEDAPLLGDVGPYSAAKVQAEEMALACRARVTVFRPGIIYGSGSPQWTERIAVLLKEHRIGDMGAAGDGCCNLVHVLDVVKAILAAVKQDDERGHHAFNLSMPDAPDWNGYFIAMAKAMGAVPVRRVTARRLKVETKLLAIPLKLGEKLLGKLLPPAITPSLARAWRQDQRLNSAKATQTLSISWMSLSEGLSEAVAGRSVRSN